MSRASSLSSRKLFAFGLAAALTAGGTFALAQQPAQPPAGQAPAGQPPAGQPAGQRPGQPTQGQPAQVNQQPDGPPPNLQPRQPRPGQPMPGQPMPGQPGQPRRPLQPGQQPGGPGQLPPGHPPIPAAGGQGEAHGGGAEGGHCPGHGPYDPPPHINWYQGLLGVNNEKSQSPAFLDRLLWRYHNPKNECDTKNQDPPLLGSVINFGVLVFILFRFGKKPVMEGLAKRKKDITHEIDSANELKLDAEKRLKTYEKQMSRIEERRQELVEEFRVQWEIEKKRILEEAHEKSERLRKDARFRVDQELKQAQADLLKEAIDGSVGAAEDLLKKRVQSTDQERLADEYLAAVGASLQGAQKS